MVPRLTEVFQLRESADLGKAQEMLKSFLTNPRHELALVMVNPSSFPDTETWKFYESEVEPILKSTGWELANEHSVVFKTEHWEASEEGLDDTGPGPWDSVEGALAAVTPISAEARAVASSPGTLKKIASAASEPLSRVSAEFTLAGAGEMLNIGVPGEEMKFSSRVKAIVRGRAGGPPSQGN